MIKIDAFYFLLMIEAGFVCLAWALYVSHKARKYSKWLLSKSRYQEIPKEGSPGKEENKEEKDGFLTALEVADKEGDPGPESMKREEVPDRVSAEEKEQFMDKVRALEKEAGEKDHSLEEAKEKNETLEKQLAEMNKKLEAMKKQYGELEKEYAILYSQGGGEKAN